MHCELLLTHHTPRPFSCFSCVSLVFLGPWFSRKFPSNFLPSQGNVIEPNGKWLLRIKCASLQIKWKWKWVYMPLGLQKMTVTPNLYVTCFWASNHAFDSRNSLMRELNKCACPGNIYECNWMCSLWEPIPWSHSSMISLELYSVSTNVLGSL